MAVAITRTDPRTTIPIDIILNYLNASSVTIDKDAPKEFTPHIPASKRMLYLISDAIIRYRDGMPMPDSMTFKKNGDAEEKVVDEQSEIDRFADIL